MMLPPINNYLRCPFEFNLLQLDGKPVVHSLKNSLLIDALKEDLSEKDQ